MHGQQNIKIMENYHKTSKVISLKKVPITYFKALSKLKQEGLKKESHSSFRDGGRRPYLEQT